MPGLLPCGAGSAPTWASEAVWPSLPLPELPLCEAGCVLPLPVVPPCEAGCAPAQASEAV